MGIDQILFGTYIFTLAAFLDLTGLPARSSYLYWLDIVEPRDVDVVYEHRFHVTDDARRVLDAHGIPLHFPALTRRKAPYRAWYFAGDFVDNTAVTGDPERAGLFFWRAFVSKDAEAELLWRWYFPLLDRIVGREASGAVRGGAP